MAKRKKSTAKEKELPDVEFSDGQLKILNPELAQKMRKWWEESKRESYAWAEIVLEPRTTTENARKQQLAREQVDSNPLSFSGHQVQFRKGRLIFLDHEMEARVEDWWRRKADRSERDWAKVAIRSEHTNHEHARANEVKHDPSHMDSNCITP